jgi:hypothetical protein
MRKPIDEFLLIKDNISEIISKNKIEELFKDVSESLANLENDILTDNLNEGFGEDLGALVVSYLSLLSKIHGVEEVYSFLDSRSHWGIYSVEHFENKKQSIVLPFYKLRRSISSFIIDGKKSLGVKELFDISAFLTYWEDLKNNEN